LPIVDGGGTMALLKIVPKNLKKFMVRKGGGFKNIKLGKNIFRQIKRRGAPDPLPPKKQPPKKKN
jgi:hypothetical protein